MLYQALLYAAGCLIVLAAVTGAGRLSRAMGGNVTAPERKRFAKHPNYSAGKFANAVHTSMDMRPASMAGMLRDVLFGKQERRPRQPLPVVPLDLDLLEREEASVTWFGHSAYLVVLDGKKLFVDPMLGRSPSPVPIAGSKRYSSQLPAEAGGLPDLDAVLITHDHYDHLDYSSIIRLKDKTGHYFVPAGVANHLVRWGVERDRITELAWWEEVQWNGLTLACTPARHFSGRGLFNRNSTLWSSWVLLGREARVFVGGDSGYGPHFKEIGAKYGPFDITMMECGQYDERWSSIHMFPEETVQAHQDAGGELLLPVHWGAFTLAFHDWREPVERALAEAGRKGVRVTTPRIGETVVLHRDGVPAGRWWR